MRKVDPLWKLPARFFVGWWRLIGVNKALAAAAGLTWIAGWLPDDGYFAVLYLNLIILCASLVCLLCYFSILLTGRIHVSTSVWTFYAGFYVLLTYNLAAGTPTSVVAGDWRTFHVSANPTPPLRNLIILLLLIVPQLAAAIAYLSLALRSHDPAARYRIVLVALAIVAWTFSIFFVSLPAFASNATMQVGSRLIGAGGALFALFAYRPPGWVARRLGDIPAEVTRRPAANLSGGESP